MSFVQTSIFDDGFVECPACGEYVLLDVEELELFNKGDSVPVCCYDCNTIFYLEKEEDYEDYEATHWFPVLDAKGINPDDVCPCRM